MGQAVQVDSEKVNTKKAEIELALIEFGLELKRIRESKDIKQVRLHELSGVDKTVISELERGLYTPSLNIIRQLAEGLGITPYPLLAAYYGIPLPNYDLKDKEALDKFINLAIEYMADTKDSKLTVEQLKARGNRREIDAATGDPIADATPDVEPPINPESNPGQAPTDSNPTESSQLKKSRPNIKET